MSEIHCKQPAFEKRVFISVSLVPKAKTTGIQYLKWLVVRLSSDQCMSAIFLTKKTNGVRNNGQQ